MIPQVPGTSQADDGFGVIRRAPRLLDSILIPNDAEDGTIYLTGQMGVFMTRAEWEFLRSKVDAFFATYPDGEIKEYNDEWEEEYHAKAWVIRP